MLTWETASLKVQGVVLAKGLESGMLCSERNYCYNYSPCNAHGDKAVRLHTRYPLLNHSPA